MNPFFWLAGADSEALLRCSTSEKIKIAGIGALVLIPAILGYVSLSYVLTTVISNDYFPYFGGFLWGIVVLSIVRQLVTISYDLKIKSTENNNLWRTVKKSWLLAFLKLFIRLFLAICIGIMVSQPLVLRIFDSYISELLYKEKDQKIQATYNTGLVKINDLYKPIREKEEIKRCYEKWLTYEKSGVKTFVEPCSMQTSGLIGCGARCDQVIQIIITLDKEIVDLRKRIDLQNEQIEKLSKTERENIEKNFSMDYLKRVDTLNSISQKESNIALLTNFLMFFFILVNIMPIVTKLVTNTEEYENEVSLELIRTNLMREAAAFAYKTTIMQNTTEFHKEIQHYEDTKKTVDNLMQASCDLLEIAGNKYEEFEKQKASYKAKIKDLPQDEKDKATEYLIKIKDIFVSGIELAIKKASLIILEDRQKKAIWQNTKELFSDSNATKVAKENATITFWQIIDAKIKADLLEEAINIILAILQINHLETEQASFELLISEIKNLKIQIKANRIETNYAEKEMEKLKIRLSSFVQILETNPNIRIPEITISQNH